MKPNGRVVLRRTVRPLRKEEIHSPVEENKREIFNALIRKKLGNSWVHRPADLGNTGVDDDA